MLFPPLPRLSPVGDVASAVENASAAYSSTSTGAPYEYLDQAEIEGKKDNPQFINQIGFCENHNSDIRRPAWLRCAPLAPSSMSPGGA
jgi:hypothetical protein